MIAIRLRHLGIVIYFMVIIMIMMLMIMVMKWLLFNFILTW